ncbi:MAG: NADH-quinone oxidoreductase subunit L [Gemmatimonadaceae bacterium]
MILQSQELPPVARLVLEGRYIEWLWLVPVLPLLGFVINGLLSLVAAVRLGPADPFASHDAHDGAAGHPAAGGHADDHQATRHRFATITSIVGPGVVILAFLLSFAIFSDYQSIGGSPVPFIERYFTWIVTGDLRLEGALMIDQLSLIMLMVVTGVGALIHVFSVGYMREDPGYPRYFAYLNLFIFFMLLLVLGANYPVMFIGWEGVGLCSYLLIGFWFSEKANADAGKKAFIVNRIGDFGFLVAMFLLFANFGSLDFLTLAATFEGATGSVLVTAICLFLFLGCTGKSAQIPLYVWLPDAMAGPTPVSALIHAATMVTAGVYLIARSHFLFAIAPVASLTVVVIGALTAILAATIAMKQWDIKKVLAYSTVSQLGYMFVGVGAGAYVSGMFHLVTHAFFKALLFLGSGSVIYAMHRAYHATHSHEDAQDMRNMGGLRNAMPWTWALMWIATLAIAGVPPLSGFFSKDEILASVFARARGSTFAEATWLGIPGSIVLYACYAIGLAAALLTAIYMTRMMIYTFHGPSRTGEKERPHLGEAPWIMTAPLIGLGVLTAVGGWLNLPSILPIGPTQVLEHWLDPVVGESAVHITHGQAPHLSHALEYGLIGVAVGIAAIGIWIAWSRLDPKPLVPKSQAKPEEGFQRVLEHKYYVDELYEKTIVKPTYSTSRNLLWRGIDVGLIDGLMVNGSAWFTRGVGWLGSALQSGQVGTYAWVLVLGVLAVVGAVTFVSPNP